jgi:Rrf2 family nitric oxide-sensitive transcriptional repressor
MHLTRYTDYSLRVLLYLGTHEERVCSISEIAKAYGISQNHLMKVVHNLGKAGYVKSVRGRLGGVRLAKACEEINIGAVVRLMEEDLQLVDCGSCLIAPACGLTSALNTALSAFMAVLDGFTLADLMKRRAGLARLLRLEPA